MPDLLAAQAPLVPLGGAPPSRCATEDRPTKTVSPTYIQNKASQLSRTPFCLTADNDTPTHIYLYIAQKVAPMVSARVIPSLVTLSLHGAGAFHAPLLPSTRASSIRTATAVRHVSSMSAPQDTDTKSFYPFQRSAPSTRCVYVCAY